MTKQLTALELADSLEASYTPEIDMVHAADKIRVLYSMSQELMDALKNLLEDSQHKDHQCDDEDWCPVLQAQQTIKKWSQV